MTYHSKNPLLDQFSTSPTGLVASPSKSLLRCVNHAPYFAYQVEGMKWALVQGCCNDWTCPRCGLIRARAEYGRIVEGCKSIAQDTGLRFLTITTRGRELSVKDAEVNYLEWTNRFLDACRQKSKRAGKKWAYVQVTERQKRRHPHSHILTTFNPGDLYLGHVQKWTTDTAGRRIASRQVALRSDWIQNQVTRSGLGEQYDISVVETVEGAARYVAKYLFKPSIFNTQWPARWKRVRYSQSFPQLPERDTSAIVLLTAKDWWDLACCATSVTVTDEQAYHMGVNVLAHWNVKIIDRRGKKDKNK